jgi:hypothetical protein
VERVCVDLNAARLIHRLDHLSCNIQFSVLLLLFLGLLNLLEDQAIILKDLIQIVDVLLRVLTDCENLNRCEVPIILARVFNEKHFIYSLTSQPLHRLLRVLI